ncbi:uncharacterized protein SPAPADRAFT_59095 [Spathaspora passalidarum NRRL Y-27907]|uniref:ER membrane protein complex subunit 10 n=1 Tax=Spathaspora passalidarum (strain NRRL Y-27907 / 11-Y1) TaxID=619300 RepID=G3AIL6_SPAPN|nr:uncharacterized protein SPAPADRAFT_59095 [Spathaspora passalidarum NRRL Y-27907]EGW33731.1 hypothetical protein SPAPADRAFT_59095 [Spathaspora passalidarum NRRL Y-27907]
MKLVNLIILSISALAAAENRINLFTKDLDTSVVEEIGYLSGKSLVLNNGELQSSASYCIGTTDVPNSECFAYVKGINSLNKATLHVFLDSNKEISHLSISHDSVADVKHRVKFHAIGTSATPNLNPQSLKKQKEQANAQTGPRVEKVTKKKIVKVVDEHGNTVDKEIEEEVEVEVDERSWVQKNWMYIVIALLMFMALGGEDKKKQA